MGVDTIAILPGNVRLKHVTKAIGKILGCGHVWEQSGTARWITVKDAKAVNSHTPEMAIIEISQAADDLPRTVAGRIVQRKPWLSFCYHLESDSSPLGRRLSLGRSRADAIALGKRLVEFFGGTLIYQDSDYDECYARPAKPDSQNRPTDGSEWDDLQWRLSEIKPLTDEEISACDIHAAHH